ncbi:MAG: serine/threonine-protein kinase [Myxococcota bacterium]
MEPRSQSEHAMLGGGGRVIGGRYKLVRRIGRGGMGGVWEAIDQKLDCPIALKLVRSASDAKEQQQRFLREAKLSAAVQHPAVVRVTDYGVHNGQPFIAMELLSGESLQARMVNGPPLAQSEAVQICITVLRGLSAAHAAGIVHRDIKPDNVQLVEDGDSFFPKLIDFGISLGRLGDRTVSAVTTNGHVFGTPMYMSPEHARGLDVDGRSDLYSVGVMLYELLCGEPPFDEGNIADLTASIMRDVPRSPHVRAGVPSALSDVVMKALAKNPADRFPSARGMAAALVEAVPGLSARLDETTGAMAITRTMSTSGERAIPTFDPDDETADGFPALRQRRRSAALLLGGLAFVASVGVVVASRGEPEVASSYDGLAAPSAPTATARSAPAEQVGEATAPPPSAAEAPSPLVVSPSGVEPVDQTADPEPSDAPATETHSQMNAPARASRSRDAVSRPTGMMRASMRARSRAGRFRTLDY